MLSLHTQLSAPWRCDHYTTVTLAAGIFEKSQSHKTTYCLWFLALEETCSIRDFYNHIVTSIIVALPTITKQPSSTVVEASNVATFECSARSYGIASITWKRLKSELPVTANAIEAKSLKETTSALRIEKTIGYYEGYYYCVIENSVGQVNSSFAYCKITGT